MRKSTALSVFILLPGCMLAVTGSTFWSTILDIGDKCKKPQQTHLLIKLLKLKPTETELAPFICLGISKSLKVCTEVFSTDRWNCSLEPTSFLKVVTSGTKEQAYIYSFVSAGVVKEVAQACAENKLPHQCPCTLDPSTTGRYHQTGCPDNYTYGNWVVKNILQPVINEGNNSKTRYINGHNINVGSEFTKRTITTKCTCEPWYSCNVRICRNCVRSLSYIENQIKFQNSNLKIRKQFQTRKRRDKHIELLHENASPDFCSQNNSTGSLGTTGRVCEDNCDHLCCGRGHYTKTVIKLKTVCRFRWCCRVFCDKELTNVKQQECQ
ncbi:protein Wnt-11b-2-like [Corticium candelabrum]|uniref:protein Wnt-11b-2-like n=1 Tax=Corticium candelabrum TaxID=121492 RepID=UPI002E25CD21|nr:protein Wnt-11b-2-like [Corticium candelabrum]